MRSLLVAAFALSLAAPALAEPRAHSQIQEKVKYPTLTKLIKRFAAEARAQQAAHVIARR